MKHSHTPELFMALEIKALCAGPFGAVSPLDLPSWFIAVILRIAMADKDLAADCISTTTVHPSPRPYPSPDASNVLHRPTGDNACM